MRVMFSAEGGPGVRDGAVMELQAEEKRGECVPETEVSGVSENAEMVVEVDGEWRSKEENGFNWGGG